MNEPESDNQYPPGALRLGPRLSATNVEFAFVSSSGPGGQNVNKRATKCQLRVAVTNISLSAAGLDRLRGLAGMYLTERDEILIARDENRSQGRNKDACVEALSELVQRAATVPKTRRKTRPTRGSVERRLREKKHNSDRKRGRGEAE